MAVSDEHRRQWDALVAALQETESDELASGDQLRAMVDWANARRVELGIEPFAVADEESVERPEEELYRRARTLGMVGGSFEGRR